MRFCIIVADGVAVPRDHPGLPTDGDIPLASREELQAANLRSSNDNSACTKFGGYQSHSIKTRCPTRGQHGVSAFSLWRVDPYVALLDTFDQLPLVELSEIGWDLEQFGGLRPFPDIVKLDPRAILELEHDRKFEQRIDPTVVRLPLWRCHLIFYDAAPDDIVLA
jgi:hypothetical protein